MTRRSYQAAGFSHLHDAPGIQHRDTIRHVTDYGEVMTYQNVGKAFLTCEVFQQI